MTRLQSLLYDRVGTLTNYEYFILVSSHNDGHALSCRVKLNDVQKLVLTNTISCLANHVTVSVPTIKLEAKMACPIDQSQFVGRGCIISCVFLAFFSLLIVRDNSVAQTKSFNKLLDAFIFWMTYIIQSCIKLWIVKVHIGDA